MDKDTLVTLVKFKRWMDGETLKAIKTIDEPAHGQKRHLMIRLMNHIYVVDTIFKANLTGQQHGYTALNTPETPTLDELEVKMADSTAWYIQYVDALSSFDLEKVITFRFVDGGDGEMRAIDMLNHVLFHGTYHRGAVGWMISECGGVAPKDVLTVFLRDHHH
ncbi:DinB family protein [Kosakonia cowanii]|uniref:DinB family protein n=1 Tax=Kosakonia cowanii TaxID=208223 RepID=UPI0023F7998F|nr:DinB family protein [Kosakonia cowanii]MDF7759738.1 DinB family protein [Kosakonia cowanii]